MGARSRMCYVGWVVWVHGGSAVICYVQVNIVKTFYNPCSKSSKPGNNEFVHQVLLQTNASAADTSLKTEGLVCRYVCVCVQGGGSLNVIRIERYVLKPEPPKLYFVDQSRIAIESLKQLQRKICAYAMQKRNPPTNLTTQMETISSVVFEHFIQLYP